ncbi:MAG: helix-turn-helix transcriptional regulator [Clostridia bacterium]|nr:helix-turn-helix transcriptional regulator [Clostridia bacterium]
MNIEGLKHEFIENINARPEEFVTKVVEYFEIVMPSDGACVIAVNGYGYDVKADEFAVVLPDEAFRFVKAEANTSVSVLKIYPYVAGVGPELETSLLSFKEKFISKKLRVFSFPASKWGLARDCMVRICLSEIPDTDGWQFAYLATMLSEIKSFGEPSGPSEAEPVYMEKEMPIFEEVAGFIAENLTKIESLTFLQEKTGQKTSTVNRVFRKLTGTSTWNYILRKRLDLACVIIIKGGRAAEAATASGFKDYSVFYRLFMGTYGIAPTAVKKTGNVPMKMPRSNS